MGQCATAPPPRAPAAATKITSSRPTARRPKSPAPRPTAEAKEGEAQLVQLVHHRLEKAVQLLERQAPTTPDAAACWSSDVLVERRNSATPETADGELKECLHQFPHALRNPQVEKFVFDVLSERGYTGWNTLFAHSTCPDEVNYDEPDTDLVNIMHRRWGKKFTLGGLAGFPFCGRTGWGAFSAHTPFGTDDGRILILFAPHCGIGSDGKVGRLRREGHNHDSTCCGAAVAAFGSDYDHSKAIDKFDPQQCIIMGEIARWKARISEDVNPDRALVYANYHACREYLRNIVSNPEKVCTSITVVGGLMVNLPDPFEDRFVPLTFESYDCKTGVVEDLLPTTFGARDAPSMGVEADDYSFFPLPTRARCHECR